MPRNRSKTEHLPTYGEAYTKWSFDVNGWNYRFDDVPPLKIHQPRMKRKEADAYYTAKLNKEFTRLGYTRKPRVQYIPEPSKAPEVFRPAYKVEGFDTVEDYYAFYEASRFKNELGIAS